MINHTKKITRGIKPRVETPPVHSSPKSQQARQLSEVDGIGPSPKKPRHSETPVTAPAPEKITSTSSSSFDRGPAHLIFHSLGALSDNFGGDFLDFNKPFFFFSQGKKFFVPAKQYMEDHVLSMMWTGDNKSFELFYNKLQVGFVTPFSKEVVALGTILEVQRQFRHRTECLLQTAGGKNSSLNEEEDFMGLAVSEFCFRTGSCVPKNPIVADSFAAIKPGETNKTGNSQALHYAAENNDFQMFSYFAERGNYALIESHSDARTTIQLLIDEGRSVDFFEAALRSISNPYQFRQLELILRSYQHKPRFKNQGLIEKKIRVLRDEVSLLTPKTK